MVALGIFMVVTAAVVPQMIVGLRAAATARDVTQTKGVGQAQLEKMRDMPFYVGQSAGDYRDVLDTYYRNTTPPSVTPSCAATTVTALPPTTWSGYVAAAPTGTHCSWEPSGPLYRKVINPVEAPGLGVFSMVVSTQFLSSATPPVAVAPPSTYNSQLALKDAPPSPQLGVTVAVFYPANSGFRSTVTFTQIEQSNALESFLTSEAKASTVRITSALNADTTFLEQLGVINLSGELFTGSRVVATAAAGTAGTSLGEQISGAVKNLVAPADSSASSSTVGGVALPSSSCSYMCLGGTTVDQASARASDGLPTAGTASAPIRAIIPDGANNDGFRFSNGSAGTRLKLDPSKPMVSLDTSTPGSMPGVNGCAATGPTVSSYLTATGFLGATGSSVTACATAQTNTIRLFPTTFAPQGIVRIQLDRATASCGLTKPLSTVVPSASAGYAASVSYYNGSDYSAPLSLSSAQTIDPLASATILNQAVAPDLTLGDYISSWKSLVSSEITASAAGNVAEVNLPGAISIVTKPTREGVATGVGPYQADPTSVISFTVGAVSCRASDFR
jgi:hypothetical protein